MNINTLPYWVRLTPFCPFKRAGYTLLPSGSVPHEATAAQYFAALKCLLPLDSTLKRSTSAALRWCRTETVERSKFKTIWKRAPIEIRNRFQFTSYRDTNARRAFYAALRASGDPAY